MLNAYDVSLFAFDCPEHYYCDFGSCFWCLFFPCSVSVLCSYIAYDMILDGLY